MDIKTKLAEWVDTLQFDKEREHALITDVGKFRDCTMEPDGDHHVILDFSRRKRGWIRYDVENDSEPRQERCVVIGGHERDFDYYILVVVPTRVDGEYRRVGVGTIHCSYVEKCKKDVRVV